MSKAVGFEILYFFPDGDFLGIYREEGACTKGRARLFKNTNKIAGGVAVYPLWAWWWLRRNLPFFLWSFSKNIGCSFSHVFQFAIFVSVWTSLMREGMMMSSVVLEQQVVFCLFLYLLLSALWSPTTLFFY